MENLKIHNFLILKNVDIDIKQINLFIGPQANGKSVIVRLVHFFRKNLNETFFGSVKENLNKRELDKSGLSKFEKAFPKYTWENQVFSITYSFDRHQITINSTKKNDGKSTLHISYTKELCDIRNSLKKNFNQTLLRKVDPRKKMIGTEDSAYYESYQKIFGLPQNKHLTSDSIFIPAGRSFFANVHENIFSLLASGTFEFDHLLAEFGSRYTTAKRYYQEPRFWANNGNSYEDIKPKLNEIVKKILKGDYLYENKKDWIKTDDRKISVANSSSGQQEALPLLLLLTFWPFVLTQDSGAAFIIEEPEAHLFPTAQKNVINLLSMIFNNSGKRHKFLLTTHSPFVLTAINLLIMAEQARTANPKAVIDPDFCIPFKNVSAYKVENGTAEDILDYENELIGSSIIDDVSFEFDSEFARLLNIKYPS